MPIPCVIRHPEGVRNRDNNQTAVIASPDEIGTWQSQ